MADPCLPDEIGERNYEGIRGVFELIRRKSLKVYSLQEALVLAAANCGVQSIRAARRGLILNSEGPKHKLSRIFGTVEKPLRYRKETFGGTNLYAESSIPMFASRGGSRAQARKVSATGERVNFLLVTE